MRLLVTRPEPDGERTGAALRARGHSVLLAPLMHIVPDPTADLGPGPFAAMAMTSANAARAIAAHPRRTELIGVTVFAVGQQTAAAATEAGFGDVTSADGNASDLAQAIASRLVDVRAPLLYLAGEMRRGDLGAMLAPHQITVRTIVVYRAEQVREMPSAARAALIEGAVDGVVHFSARSAETYVALARAGGLTEAALAPVHCCLSAQVAKPLRAAGARRVLVAPRPDEAVLIGLMDRPAS